MKIIGVTGPIGAGKSYVAQQICKRGFPDIDTDEVYHSLISAPSVCTEGIKTAFGDDVINNDGGIDRTVLREIVFSDPEKLVILNKITHGCVTEKVDELLADYRKNGVSAVVVEVPLMFESGFDKKCDIVVCVAADTETRITRICKRNGITRGEAEKRIKNQKDIDFYIANSSFIVYNNDKEDINAQIDRLFERIF